MAVEFQQALRAARKDRKAVAARFSRGETLSLTKADVAFILQLVSSIDLTEGRLAKLAEANGDSSKTGKVRLSKELLESLDVQLVDGEDSDVVTYAFPLLSPGIAAFGIGVTIGKLLGDYLFSGGGGADSTTIEVNVEDGEVEIDGSGNRGEEASD